MIPMISDDDGVLTPHPLGLVEMTNDQYHAGPGISKSHLDAIAGKSPRHYYQKYLAPDRQRSEPTAAMLQGSAIHSAILEPDMFPTEYVAAPDDAPKRPTSRQVNAKKPSGDTLMAIDFWAEFDAKHRGKTVLDAEAYASCLAVRDAVWSHPVASGLLQGGKSEQSFFAHDEATGELIKCRTDYLHDSGAMIVDVKSTEDASPDGFGKSAANFRYTIQPAWYNKVLDKAFGEHPEHWVFLAVEKQPPYAIGVYFIEPDQLARAEIAAARDYARIVEAKRSGNWHDYAVTPMPLALPTWCRL